ncbi:beta-ketoacyl synthase N-terminal-like domain-containing protein [Nocardiopsis sp. LOL_012]|uniref:type I polyketide synthase n=1 Tax=Nocardiopsis sp. LOL_012 TaxID=3345409 RepID=UPI003A89A81C
MTHDLTRAGYTGLEIAVIGMACRFPGAAGPAEFWLNLSSGTESITRYSDKELSAAGVGRRLLQDPGYVPAGGHLEGSDRFDAAFFGINPKEADRMDPQHRILLECSWEALEDSGHDPTALAGPVAVYAGSYYNTYVDNLVSADDDDPAALFARNIANEKDYLATRIAYKLDLTGPAVTVQTACSTSLVAVHLACQSLLSGACEVALAGGATVRAQQGGYLFQPDGIFSSDGHCRSFDARAEGTVPGNGAGMVVLKRLEDALSDGDHVRAVIRGSAVGNDGADRVGFTAPGVAGQARVVSEALTMAEVDPATLGYIEAHGSATPLGDPIEVEALTRVFHAAGAHDTRCALGSVKSNIGHTHAAAGVAGLIKTVLALQHGRIPPSLHFDQPNPRIDFDATPFHVNSRLTAWPDGATPRRAGVSSFGMGGTGAHVVLEEAPRPAAARERGRAWRVCPVSARTPEALEAATDRLADHLAAHPDLPLADVARTLQTGRADFPHRRFVLAQDTSSAAEALKGRDHTRVWTGSEAGRSVAFVFPGLGEQRPGMGAELYRTEPVFRAEVDRCAEALRPQLGVDLRVLMYDRDGSAPEPSGRPNLRAMLGRGTAPSASSELDRTLYAQTATFVTELALARLWESKGIRPGALIGYSIGEYVAACLAGVLSREDALFLVADRARLIDSLPGGAMLAVPLSEERVRSLIPASLSVAAVNGPSLSVVAGPGEAVSGFAAYLEGEGVAARSLRTTHAFHSHMMDPIADEFAELVKGVTLNRPEVPYVSNVTGDWVTGDEVTDPAYWGRHMRQPVRFADGVSRLWEDSGRLLLEIGPGQALTSVALQTRPRDGRPEPGALASLPGEYERQSEQRFMSTTIGKLWLAGVELDWPRAQPEPEASRVPLPPYPFERRRHWVDPAPAASGRTVPDQASPARKSDIADWFDVPVWEPLPPHPAVAEEGERDPRTWIVLTDGTGLGKRIMDRIADSGRRVVSVRPGGAWRRLSPDAYEIPPTDAEGYRRLLREAADGTDGLSPRIVHMWTVGSGRTVEEVLELGFHSLVALGRALAEAGGASADIAVVTDGAHSVVGDEAVAPEKATVAGPCLVLPLEQPGTACRSIDVGPAHEGRWNGAGTAALFAELTTGSDRPFTALRGSRRWYRSHLGVRVVPARGRGGGLRDRGVYLITGGLGAMGLTLARHLVDTVRARIVLVGRTPLPPRGTWRRWLDEHPADDTTGSRIRAVLDLEEAGGEVLVATADITDERSVRDCADLAVERFGAVHGVIHAAGVPGGGLIQLKNARAAEDVLAPKVRGSLLMDALARDLDVDFLALCSSTLALTGAVGQVDYTSANAFEDALAQRNEALGGPRTVSINWDGWQGGGMAVRAMGGPGPEASGTGSVDHPLLHRCLVATEHRAVYEAALDVATSWLIDEHRMAGNAVVPGTGHLEMARAAYEHQFGQGRTVLRDVTFFAPVVVDEHDGRELRIVLEKDRTPVRFVVISRRAGGPEGENPWVTHSSGLLEPLGPVEPRRHDVAALIRDAGMSDLGRLEHTGPMGFGGRSRCLERVHLGETEALAELELPDRFASDLEHMDLHPSLLDLAAGFFGMNLAQEFRIPISYGRLELLAPLPARLFSHHRFREADRPGKEIFTSDVVLMDTDGREVALIEGFVLKKASDLEGRLRALREDTFDEVEHYAYERVAETSDTPVGPGGVPLEHLAYGIRPEEGAEAFHRLLDSGLGPQVVVAAKDLGAVMADIAARGVGSDPAPRAVPEIHHRPTSLTGYEAPRDETEAALARIWQDLLGIDRVGVHDGFFELGGHSLLGLQFVNRVRRELGAEVSLSTLFDALTVAELAKALVAQGEQSSTTQGVE